MKLFEAPPGMCLMPDDTVKEIAAKDAEIARLKYSIEMYQKGSIAAKKQEFNDVKLIKLLSNENEQLKAQLVAHREFAKAFDAWEERDLHYVDTALDKARKALEDK